MFGSESFPLGPNGQFPKQRIWSAGNELIAPVDMEGAYLQSEQARLPVVEKDFHASVNKVKGKCKSGEQIRANKRVNEFRPRFAPKTSLEIYEEQSSLGGFMSRMRTLLARVRR